MTLTTEPSILRTSIDRVWNALDAGGFKPEKRGDKFMALCPVHGDSHRSLSVKFDRGREAVLLNCFTCHADYRDIATALGLSAQDLFDAPLPDRGAGDKKPRRSVAFKAPHKVPPRIAAGDVDELAGATWERITSYPYTDAAGTLVEEVIREHATVDGVVHKRFSQRFLGVSGRMVARKPEGFSPVLYHHAEVLEAVKAGRPIWLAEGEKDADNAAALGLVSTTNAQGAGSFPEGLADVLAGATVNLVADRDVAGYKRASTLHSLLTGKGATVRILLPAIVDEKADLTDHLDAGHGVADLIEITPEDASVLALVGEAQRALVGLEVCRVEAIAHMDAAKSSTSDEESGRHRADATTWAHEAEIRFRRLNDSGSGMTLFADSYGIAGQAAASTMPAIVDDAAQLAAEVHRIAEIPEPASIVERLAKSQGRVIDLAGSGGGIKPPRFLGNDFIPGDDNPEIIGAKYLVVKGQTVQHKIERDGDGYRNRYHRIMDGWAEIIAVAVDDDGNDSTSTRAAHQMTVKFSRWARDNVTGKTLYDDDGEPVIEEEFVKWGTDDINKGTWVNALPWGVAMLESSSRRGRDIAWDAIHKARRAPNKRTVVYTTSGWREAPTGAFFVHAGGGIAKGGSLPLETDLGSAFAVYNLPEPSEEAAALRAAWLEGTGQLRENLPARVLAPLLGVTWRSVFERAPMLTHLQGGFASFKTSTARVACQYFAPDLHFHGKREVLSGANSGGTILGLIRALAIANYLPVLIDDVAPDGDVKAAQKKLSSLARVVYNGTSRTVGKQRGGIDVGDDIKATVITTGEMSVPGSAQSRILTLPLDPGTIVDGGTLFAKLERASARRSRGLLGASLIQWVAEHRPALVAEHEATIDNPDAEDSVYAYWKNRAKDLPGHSGATARLIDPAIIADHGIKLMLRMLVHHGALSREEADEFFQWAADGIFEAIGMQDVAAGDPAEQLINYLRDALTSNAGHITTDNGGRPEKADIRGWTKRGEGQFENWTPNGDRLGVIKHEGGEERLFLIPSAVLGAVNRMALRADETFAESMVSISSAMVAHGWLKTSNSGKRGVARRFGGQQQRVWDIPLSVLTGDDEDDDTKPDSPTPPAPSTPPSLFDVGPNSTGTQSPPETPAAGPSLPDTPETVAPAPTPTPLQPRRAAAPAGEFRAAAAVLHTDGLWLPDGERITLSQPIEHLGDFAKLVAELKLGTMNGWKREDGQILLTYEAALELGIHLDEIPESTAFDFTTALKTLTRDHPLITKAIDAGYSIGGKEPVLNATTRIWHADNQRLRARLVLLPALKDDFKHILAGDADAATIARRLQRFADALHAPYAISASTTGIDLMLTLHWKDRERIFAPSNPVPPAEISTLEADIDWQRKPTAVELEHKYIHAYDRGGSYLAGISGLELGTGEPRYFSEGTPFDRRQPGYWKIAMPTKGEWLLPNPIDPRNREDDITGKLTWVSTPTLDVAASLGYEFDVVEAYVWEQHSRILDTWYERVRDARTSLDTADLDDQAARNLLKEVYVRSLGLTASFDHHKGRLGFAPERYHFIQARARANIIRRIQKIGAETDRWPVAVSKDTVLYTSNEVDPALAWPGEQKDYGRGLGQYKYERSGELVDQLQFLTGTGRYLGKEQLNVEWIG